MYSFRQITPVEFETHPIRSALPETTVFQTPSWLAFLRDTQKGEPIVLLVEDRGGPVGYLTGMIVSKFGIRILGSPFPGWSTSYMGFTLAEGIDRKKVLSDFRSYAFEELRCDHFEMMDRLTTHSDLDGLKAPYVDESGYELDLTVTEESMFTRMTHQTRTNVRKAVRSGLVVEETRAPEFVDEYYSQVRDVFGKRQLVPTFPIERVRSLFKHVAMKGHATLFRTLDAQGKCVATAIMLGTGTQAYLWGAASYRDSQQFRPNELLYWSLMKRARELGRHRLDMVGDGDYKRKYGGQPICVPWFRASRHPMLEKLRDIAETAVSYRQRALGKLLNRSQPVRIVEPPGKLTAA